ncbi:hypothetical protein ACFXPZ_41585, partial [Streptomyces sp. NPDC059101]|uniref:hypothetical protein n=1 Tax=Streptomyces sp. NPDC059101 TaxID=3346728 RepID=UPI0036C727B4
NNRNTPTQLQKITKTQQKPQHPQTLSDTQHRSHRDRGAAGCGKWFAPRHDVTAAAALRAVEELRLAHPRPAGCA